MQRLIRSIVSPQVRCLLLLIFALLQAGCPSRQSGQVEIFGTKNGRVSPYGQFAAPPTTRNVIPGMNDPIRSNDDVVTIQIESTYIQKLPPRLTGSTDLIIFADIWENAAAGYNSTATLTNIV